MKPKNGSDPSYSTAEAAVILSISASTVREMVRDGSLPGWADGGRCRVAAGAVDALAAQRAATASTASEGPTHTGDESSPDREPDAMDAIDAVPASTPPPSLPGAFVDHIEAVLGKRVWLLSVDETAAVLARSRASIDAAISLGQLPARRVGHRWFVPVPELEAWLTGKDAA